MILAPSSPRFACVRSRLAMVLPFLLLVGRGSEAGMVEIGDARREGDVRVDGDRLLVADQPVDWASVRRLITDTTARTLRAPEALHMKSGEVWRVRLESLAAGKARVRSPFFGTRELDITGVASIDFVPEGRRASPSSAGRGSATGVLIQKSGRSLPGRLLWIDGERAAVDSPLGVARLPRESLRRYVPGGTGAAPRAGTAPDEIALIDGSRFRGRLEAGDGQLILVHPHLGRLAFPGSALRSLVRHAASVVDLADVKPASVKSFPLISGPVRDDGVEPVRGDAIGSRGRGFVKGLRVEPRTIVTYKLATHSTGPRVFRARIGLDHGARGDVRVTLHASDRCLFDREIVPTASPEWIAIDLPAGATTLQLEANFGTRLRFPCPLVLGDPRIEMRSKPGGETPSQSDDADNESATPDGPPPGQTTARRT